MQFYSRFGKRGLDIIFALTALTLLSLLMILVALAIRLTSRGPAIFAQQRVGLNGQNFTIFKFRSMPVSTGDVASDRLGTVQIGHMGKFIRRTNLDELPQLFNILFGDMSLVGPRPPLEQQADLIALRTQNGSLGCRPGLTGLAQVNSFDGMSVEQKANYDGIYAQKLSFGHDMAIILRTFSYVLRRPPTY